MAISPKTIEILRLESTQKLELGLGLGNKSRLERLCFWDVLSRTIEGVERGLRCRIAIEQQLVKLRDVVMDDRRPQ